MGRKPPEFQSGDTVVPSLMGRERGVEPGVYLVVEVLRGPGMRVRSAPGGAAFKVMRKHFEMFCPAEEMVAFAVMGL